MPVVFILSRAHTQPVEMMLSRVTAASPPPVTLRAKMASGRPIGWVPSETSASISRTPSPAYPVEWTR